ncbi:unnamed protein product [Protopolystoma xenopodis]|uniref:Uncharacterized protein n=1 Tax=Protopolystoma xenopodis TaxID=117903 RepID=A0A448XK75_9PLAT|nr:unnamed protein product [Protopolystoma xenopodis]
MIVAPAHEASMQEADPVSWIDGTETFFEFYSLNTVAWYMPPCPRTRRFCIVRDNASSLPSSSAASSSPLAATGATLPGGQAGGVATSTDLGGAVSRSNAASAASVMVLDLPPAVAEAPNRAAIIGLTAPASTGVGVEVEHEFIVPHSRIILRIVVASYKQAAAAAGVEQASRANWRRRRRQLRRLRRSDRQAERVWDVRSMLPSFTIAITVLTKNTQGALLPNSPWRRYSIIRLAGNRWFRR